MERARKNGPGAAATALRAKNAVLGRATVPTNSNEPSRASLFEISYKDRLWRFSLTDYGGQDRLSIWPHYRDKQTHEWRPCGSKCRCGASRESAGLFVPLGSVGELLEGLAALQLQIHPLGASEAA